jgi:hypothetical protein
MNYSEAIKDKQPRRDLISAALYTPLQRPQMSDLFIRCEMNKGVKQSGSQAMHRRLLTI